MSRKKIKLHKKTTNMKFYKSLGVLFFAILLFSGCNNPSTNNTIQVLNIKYEIIASSDPYLLRYYNSTGSTVELSNQSGNWNIEFQISASVLNKKCVHVAAYSDNGQSTQTARIYVNGVVWKEATGNDVICNGWLPE
jgi:hypothetical protein